MEEGYNGEFANKLIEAVETFASLDGACDKVREKQICDAVGVKCDLSCKVYVKKDRLLKFIEKCIKATSAAPIPEAPTTTVVVEMPKPEQEEPVCPPEPVLVTETSRERLCPSCARKAARDDSKYCDFCGEEL